jgi:hypothetical protein
MGPPIAPAGFLSRQSHNDPNGAGGNGPASRLVGLGPLVTNQVSVPTELGLGLHEGPASVLTIEWPAQAGEDRSIRRLKGQSGDLTTQDGYLMAEHDILDGQITVVAPTEAH